MQQLYLSAADMGGEKVELLAQATVAWIPPRSKAEAVPATLTNAGLAWYPGGETTLVRRPVKAADAVRLGRALNQLPPTHQYTVRSCPPGDPSFAILTLRSASHVRVFSFPLGGCRFVTVTVD